MFRLISGISRLFKDIFFSERYLGLFTLTGLSKFLSRQMSHSRAVCKSEENRI